MYAKKGKFGTDLAYYEVQEILKKNPSIKIMHDKQAAVKYFTFDKNQWISYDDKDTFKQKVEWANSVGFSGSLIWASDLGMHQDLCQNDPDFTVPSVLPC